ncbi:MAG TPA: hypothetical protein VGI58_08520 [Streptosporangiaceae bacterium]
MTRLATEVAESSKQPATRRPLALASSAQAITIYCYILGAFLVTLNLWLSPANRAQVGDPADVNQATWYVRYAATAVSHLRLPALITTAMNAPHGVNLMWNTPFLLPGVVVSPITLAFGPQVALTTLLVLGLAGSAAAMFYVLRRWNVGILAAALGGFLYGFSPALVNSGYGHYSLVLGMFLPLIADRALRIALGRGRPVRDGVWLGLLVAAQFFVSEEALLDTVIAVVIFLVVLAICRPREVVARARGAAAGLATGVVLAVVLCSRALWVQFHGVHAASAAATTTILYTHGLTNLGTLPYAFITPTRSVLLQSTASHRIVDSYPQPSPEYLAYLGIPLIIVLIAAVVVFWRHLAVRVAGITCILLEWLGLGAKPILHHYAGYTLPAALLPWGYVQHLPVISGMVPDRLCVLADAAAAIVLAFSLDLARRGEWPLGRLRDGAAIATGVAVIALLPLVPVPYGTSSVDRLPAGWTPTYDALHLSSHSRVLLAPWPWAGTSQEMRWQADTGKPGTMIGGDFIEPGIQGRAGRSGRTGLTPTGIYINDLYAGTPASPPSGAQIRADVHATDPAAVMAVTSTSSPLGRFLVQVFGPPTVHSGQVLGWRLTPGEAIPASP